MKRLCRAGHAGTGARAGGLPGRPEAMESHRGLGAGAPLQLLSTAGAPHSLSPAAAQSDTELASLPQQERLELAALWFEDALHFRTAHRMLNEQARKAHRFLHHRGVRYVRKIVILLHLMLAAFVSHAGTAVARRCFRDGSGLKGCVQEFPADYLLPKGVTAGLELVFCAVYVSGEFLLARSDRPTQPTHNDRAVS